MKVAKFIKEFISEAGAIQQLYKLDPPMEDCNWKDEVSTYEYVVVSAVVVMLSGPETYIFPANKDGEITDWGELDGSYRGGLDHEEALENAGYTVEDMEGIVIEFTN